MEMETAGVSEKMDIEVDGSLGKLDGQGVADITPDSHTEVVIDLEDIETGGGLRVGNENALDRNIVRGIV